MRFARRLGLAVGRWDWWRLKSEHTPYQWALQRIADEVEPLGEQRADMRAATNTVSLLTALIPGLGESAAAAEGEHLRNYLEFNQPTDDHVLSPAEAAALKKG